MKTVTLRFYEELNDFLSPDKHKTSYVLQFNDNQSIKNLIESQGVPHTEVDLILVNSKAVDFNYLVQDKDQISVYPVFESLDISPLNALRPRPLRDIRFILDVHLGKLARYLRLLGFDSEYRNNYRDEEIARIAILQKRIILTRDLGILKRRVVKRGYWIRSQKPLEQVKEVLARFDLGRLIDPFKHCLKCNGMIQQVPKEEIIELLLPQTRKYYNEFFRCSRCHQIYWKGSHFVWLKKYLDEFRNIGTAL